MVKLADFGVSEMFAAGVQGRANDSIKGGAGSPAFLAPECFTGEREMILHSTPPSH